MRAGACEMHVRGRVCVHENPAGSRRGSDVQSGIGEKKREREGSRQGQIGRRKGDGETQDGKACEKDSFQSVSPDRGMASWTRNEKDERVAGGGGGRYGGGR